MENVGKASRDIVDTHDPVESAVNSKRRKFILLADANTASSLILQCCCAYGGITRPKRLLHKTAEFAFPPHAFTGPLYVEHQPTEQHDRGTSTFLFCFIARLYSPLGRYSSHHAVMRSAVSCYFHFGIDNNRCVAHALKNPAIETGAPSTQ